MDTIDIRECRCEIDKRLKEIEKLTRDIRPANYDRSHPDVRILLGKMVEILGLTMGVEVK